MTQEQENKERAIFSEMVQIHYDGKVDIDSTVEAMIDEMKVLVRDYMDSQSVAVAREIVVAHHILEE